MQDYEINGTTSLPLPGNTQDYASRYEHPAYGVFNVRVISPAKTSLDLYPTEQQSVLPTMKIQFSFQLSTRPWATEMTLKHKSHTFFDMGILTVAGSIKTENAASECGTIATTSAVFNISPKTGCVEKLGIQI